MTCTLTNNFWGRFWETRQNGQDHVFVLFGSPAVWLCCWMSNIKPQKSQFISSEFFENKQTKQNKAHSSFHTAAVRLWSNHYFMIARSFDITSVAMLTFYSQPGWWVTEIQCQSVSEQAYLRVFGKKLSSWPMKATKYPKNCFQILMTCVGFVSKIWLLCSLRSYKPTAPLYSLPCSSATLGKIGPHFIR